MQEGRRRSTIRGRSSRRLGGTCIDAGGGEEKGEELLLESELHIVLPLLQYCWKHIVTNSPQITDPTQVHLKINH